MRWPSFSVSTRTPSQSNSRACGTVAAEHIIPIPRPPILHFPFKLPKHVEFLSDKAENNLDDKKPLFAFAVPEVKAEGLRGF